MAAPSGFEAQTKKSWNSRPFGRTVLHMQRKLLVFLFALLTNSCAFADGWAFRNGRFPEGTVTVFKLTRTQKAFLDLIRRCHKDNRRSPYLFVLTPQQAAVLRRKAGFSPERFAVFEGYRGDKGIDLDVNAINRFSEDEFEVPHRLLTRSQKAQDWEVNTMGWLPNPLLKARPTNFKGGSCP